MRDKSVLGDSEFQLELFDAAIPIGAEAVAGSGIGLDHWAGERVLCGALYRMTPRNHEHRMALAITDRRTAVGGWSDIKGNFNGKRCSIPHAELARADSKTGLLAAHLGLVTARGKTEITLSNTQGIQALDAFYKALCAQVPPQARVEPPAPFPAPSPDDPTGVRAAREGLWFQDPGATRMLDILAQSSMDPAHVADLVSRVVLLHRMLGGGPGMRDSLWTSPMSANDLGATLLRIYGSPQQHGEPHPGVYSADFAFDPERDPIFTAAQGLGVASKVIFGIGLSPTRMVGRAIAEAMMRKDPVRQLRFVFGDRGSFAGYQIQTPGRVLEDHDAAMAHRIHQVLMHYAYAVLERRCALGWGASYADLWARD